MKTEIKQICTKRLSFQSKVNFLKDKYGINSFGCSFEDLSIFSCDEVTRLCSMGLIYTQWHKKFLMNNDGLQIPNRGGEDE